MNKAQGRAARLKRIEALRDVANVQELISNGMDVNSSWFDIGHPLALVAQHGYVEACKFLLSAGADPLLADDRSGVPVLCRAVSGRAARFDEETGWEAEDDFKAICTMLVAAGANPNGLEVDGIVQTTQCPLYLAAEKGDIKAVEIMASLGANLNQPCVDPRTKMVRTAMFSAKDRRSEDMMIDLIRLGAYHGGRNNFSAFEACVADGLDKVVEFYVREKGESLSQLVNDPDGAVTLREFAKFESTKHLLSVLATELAIEGALVVEEGGAAKVARPKLNTGMAL
jgi:ankyrin repeat protein